METKKRQHNVHPSIEKVSKSFSLGQETRAKGTLSALKSVHKGFRIPFVHMPLSFSYDMQRAKHCCHLLSRPKTASTRFREITSLKQEFQRGTKSFAKEEMALYHGASETDRCVDEQDLHLFNLKKIFSEKFHKIRNVTDLKLPRVVRAKQHLKFFVNQVLMSRYSPSYHHNVVLISEDSERKKREEEEKALKENLEMQLQGSEARRYQYSGFSSPMQ